LLRTQLEGSLKFEVMNILPLRQPTELVTLLLLLPSKFTITDVRDNTIPGATQICTFALLAFNKNIDGVPMHAFVLPND